MQEAVELFFDWVGRNENILSGLVAIAVLISLLWAAVRRISRNSMSRHRKSDEPALVRTSAPQEIRYCRTVDDIRIAYAITGSGYPMVRSLGWFTNLEMEWSSEVGRAFWERMSRNHQLIRYDGRGIGLSEKTTKFSAETRLRDLEAVIDAAGVDRFALTATSEGCRTAIRYASQNPERVSHLVLYGAAVPPRGDSEYRKEGRAYVSLISTGWARPSHQRLFTDLFLGQGSSQQEIDYFQAMQAASASAEVAAAYFRSLGESESGFELASKISTPTLVLHYREDQMCPFSWGQALAAEIPNARFMPLEGDCHWLLMSHGRGEEYVAAIEEFIQTS